MNLLNQISDALEAADDEKVYAYTKLAIAQGLSAKDILDLGLIAGMNRVGEKFGRHEIFLPEVLLAAKAMYRGMDEVKPLLLKSNIPTLGKVVVGTVHGDLHDIGKNLVAIMLKGAGFEVIDLGKGVSPEQFVQAAVEQNAKVIGMSALLTTTMSQMRKVTDLLLEKNLKGKIKTVIGGAPVTKEFAKEIGADAYCYDAAQSVTCVKQLAGIC